MKKVKKDEFKVQIRSEYKELWVFDSDYHRGLARFDDDADTLTKDQIQALVTKAKEDLNRNKNIAKNIENRTAFAYKIANPRK